MYVIEHWVRAKVVPFSIARLEFSNSICPILLIPFTLCPIRRIDRLFFHGTAPPSKFSLSPETTLQNLMRKPRTDIGEHGYSVLDNGGHLVREKCRFYRTCQIPVGFDRRTDILREVWNRCAVNYDSALLTRRHMHFRQIPLLCWKIADFRAFQPFGGHYRILAFACERCNFPLRRAGFKSKFCQNSVTERYNEQMFIFLVFHSLWKQ